MSFRNTAEHHVERHLYSSVLYFSASFSCTAEMRGDGAQGGGIMMVEVERNWRIIQSL